LILALSKNAKLILTNNSVLVFVISPNITQRVSFAFSIIIINEIYFKADV